MGSKVSAPPVPDYAPIAAANEQTAERAFEMSQQQFDWSQQQYNEISPYVFQNLEAQAQATTANQQFAEEQRARYQSEYAPIESDFTQRALNYNTPERAAQQSALAQKDVEKSIDAQRQAALTNLSSYGLDPSETKYGAIDASYRINKAAAMAAAGTQSRLATEATGLALQGEAINIGRGYPGAIAQSYATATNAGASGIKGASTNYAVGADAMGSPVGYLGASTQARAGQVGALNTGYQNALAGQQLEAQSAADTLYGIGNIVGAVGRTAVGFGMGG